MAMTKVRKRAATIAVAVLAAGAAAAVVIPALAASAPGAVRLHLGSDGQYFAYGTTQQNLTTNACAIKSPEPVIDLSADGTKAPGLASNGIGVKTPNSTGTPCGQVDSTETLRLARGPSLGGRQFTGVRLDLEMTKDALVRLTLASGTTSATYTLQTGGNITAAQFGEAGYDTTVPYLVSSGPGDELDACAAPNSSGPNSGANDNCQWTVIPGFSFDTITLTTTTGTVALEGSGDFGNNPDYETLLYLANTAPTATNDSYSTDEDVSRQGNVLTNDSDADGNPLTAAVVSGPTHGSLSFASTGAFTYVPDHDWFGTDSFTYAASDGTTTTNATATITVTSVNDPPVARSSSTSTPEETSVTVTVATDVDSGVLTASCTSTAGGSIVDNRDGSVTFTPPLDFNGTITLTCSVTDGDGATTASSASVTVGVANVNDAPVAGDDSADVNAGSSIVIDVLGNDTDVDGDTLSVTDIDNVTPAGATAVPNEDGTVTYTPPAGFDGDGSFTYRATDGDASSNAATVRITVYPVICSNDTVSDTDGAVTGAFTRLTDQLDCKRYALEAVDTGDTITFTPDGGDLVNYRGELTFDAVPAPGGTGELSLLLRYDPTGGDNFRPVQWCVDPQFSPGGVVTGATLPEGETWCIASALTRGNASGDVLTTWQVYGRDDPKFVR